MEFQHDEHCKDSSQGADDPANPPAQPGWYRGKIVITPKVMIDRPKLQIADNDYTPRQRKLIQGQLEEGLEDVIAGRVHGPFRSAKEASVYVEKAVRTQAGTKPTKRKA